MPQYVPWDPAFRTGNAIIDAQHEALLGHCNRLADLCSREDGTPDEQLFDDTLAQLKTLARKHFETESALQAGEHDPDGDQGPDEADEFQYLMDEVATASNFERLELQRFLAVWCLGHIRGMAGP